MIKATFGNAELLKLHKTAFLCSRKVLPETLSLCYEWAVTLPEEGHCLISGFHSATEKEILRFLLKTKHPIILTLARGINKALEPVFQRLLDENRLLVISPFPEEIKSITAQTAQIRNKLIINLADDITAGYVTPNGQLEELLGYVKDKPINILS